ncbi:MAG: 2-oxo acid dehydrogenase subunit E2 [Lachnospiraceae bacterium]|nr:2-oxo acid dehydrogenase subunit E2 [Lachnospiraceae bacterium]
MAEKRKKRFGDRRDGFVVRDITGLQKIMFFIFPKRTESEVCLTDKLDVTELMKFLEKKNASHPEYKTTVFHAFLTAIARCVKERPKLNRFIQGWQMYERYDITLSFIAKRRFADGAEEALLTITAQDDDTLDSISHRIYGDVRKTRKSEHSTGGIDEMIDKFAKIPRLLLALVLRLIRYLDFWGINIPALTEGDTNYASVLASNLGSIGCPAVYHHLNNYGTNSFMTTLGAIHKEEMLMPDGHKEIRDVVDFTAILDERIGDGFYFARSLKLVKAMFANPEMFDKPLSEPSGFEYK